MKKIILGLTATILLTFNGFTSNVENPIKAKIIIETQVKDNSNEKTTFTINFNSITDLKKFDVNELFLKTEVEESCTACVTISVAGNGVEICATASTCKRAVGMLLEML